MIKEIILSSLMSFSVSVRTPNDATQPLDYEFMTKLEKTDGYVTYLLKRDWEREYGMKYIDNVAKLNLNVYDNSYCGFDYVDKTSKDINYLTYDMGFYTDFGLKTGVSSMFKDEELKYLASVEFNTKAKKNEFEYLIAISAKTDLSENQIFNIKSELKRWFGEKINVFALYEHEYYNEKEDFQFKVGLGVKL